MALKKERKKERRKREKTVRKKKPMISLILTAEEKKELLDNLKYAIKTRIAAKFDNLVSLYARISSSIDYGSDEPNPTAGSFEEAIEKVEAYKEELKGDFE